MALRQPAPEVVVWTDPAHAQLCVEVLERMGEAVKVLAVGGNSSGEVVELARRWECPFVDDFRRLITERPAAYLLWASTEAVGGGEMQSCLEQGTYVLAMEPVVADLEEWSGLGERRGSGGIPPGRGAVLRVPAFIQSPGWRASAEAVENLGRLEGAVFLLRVCAARFSLCALLVDAWMTLLRWYDMPETVTAACYSREGGYVPTMRARRLSGQLHAMGRLADGRAVQIHISDRAASDGRWLYLSGEGGELEVSDEGYQLLDASGRLVDSWSDERGFRGRACWADLIAEQWRRILERREAAEPDGGMGRGVERALACVQACVLSCRTGQPESPAVLLRAHDLQ